MKGCGPRGRRGEGGRGEGMKTRGEERGRGWLYLTGLPNRKVCVCCLGCRGFGMVMRPDILVGGSTVGSNGGGGGGSGVMVGVE